MASHNSRIAFVIFLMESVFIFVLGWLILTSSSSSRSWKTTKKFAHSEGHYSQDVYRAHLTSLSDTLDGSEVSDTENYSGQLMTNCPTNWPLHVIRNGIYPAQVCRSSEDRRQWRCAPSWRKLLREPYCIFSDNNFKNTSTELPKEAGLGNSVSPANVTNDIKIARVSQRRRIMFLQVPESGGEIIETSFLFEKPENKSGDIGGNIYSPAAWYRKEPFQSYLKFGMIRHPCSRLISLWKHLSKNTTNDSLAVREYTHNIDSFLELLLFPEKSIEGDTKLKLYAQVEILFDENGTFEGDYLFVYEKWNGSIEYFARVIGKEVKKLMLPDEILNDQPKCTNVFSPTMWSKLTTFYAMDFCVFGYSTLMRESNVAPLYQRPPHVLNFRFAECKKMFEKRQKSSTMNVQSGKPSNKTCFIYTYFEVNEVKNAEEYMKEQNETLAAWKWAWSSAGWTPIVLTEQHAKQHSEYGKLRKKFWDLPTINNKEYEMACFLRHVAMASVGGGWMSDYDILPLRILPCTDLPNEGQYTTHERFVPSLVSGNGTEFTRVSNLMANIDWQSSPKEFSAKAGVPHVSDMICTRSLLNNGAIHGTMSVIEAREFFNKPFSCNRTARVPGDSVLSPLSPGLPLLPWTIHFSHRSVKEMSLNNITFEGIHGVYRRDYTRPAYVKAAFKYIRNQCNFNSD